MRPLSYILETLIAVIALLLVALLFLAFLFFILASAIESGYMIVFNRPIYVHLYLFPKELPVESHLLLEDSFRFYSNLSERRKKFFRHRVYRFMARYRFVGMDGLEVTDGMRLKIAATWVMLTFGMRKYLTSVFKTILIFPDIFESRNGNWHKGEFNPAAKAVVFSWKHFEEGMAISTDNFNLGLHEFAHVLHIDSVGYRRPGASGVIYSDMFYKIRDYFADAANRQRLLDAGYLRNYACTNSHEFMAVALEYFFETPDEFRQKLPELYTMLRVMINYREK